MSPEQKNILLKIAKDTITAAVKDEPVSIPKFDDEGVRDRVLTEWKRVRARQLALQEAGNLAQTARDSGKSLKTAFADRPDIKVATEKPFSWMTRGALPALAYQVAPWISNLDGVDGTPGHDFMRTVFGLKQGEIGVAMNHSESAAYVIRLIAFNKSDDVLWGEFTADLTSGRYRSEYAAAGTAEQRQMMRAWQDELRGQAGLKWNRKADGEWPKDE